MSLPIVVIVAVTAAVTLLAFGVLVWSVMRSMTSVVADVTELRDRILPDLERIQRDADVTSRELDRVGASLDELERQRGSRAEPHRDLDP